MDGGRANLAPNLREAQRFLTALDPAGVFTFQAFSDAKDSTVRPTVRHGTIGDCGAELEALNRAGAGIFVMVNAGDGETRSGSKTCRTAANVKRVRALFLDLDGAPIVPVLESPLPPDWVVRSSPGRWHAYWRVDDCPLDRFGSAQAALAMRFDGDPSVKDLPRVMRIPGFLHRKAHPFCSELWLPADYQRILEMNHE